MYLVGPSDVLNLFQERNRLMEISVRRWEPFMYETLCGWRWLLNVVYYFHQIRKNDDRNKNTLWLLRSLRMRYLFLDSQSDYPCENKLAEFSFFLFSCLNL